MVYEKHFLRTFIHVSDMGRAFVFGIEHGDMAGNVFNIGSDDMNYSKEQICSLIANKTTTYVHYADVGSDADQRNYSVSYKKINALGFNTQVSVEQGIDELLNALRVINYKTPYTNA